MQNLPFLKPMLAEADGKTTLAIIKENHLKEAVKTTISYFAKNTGRKGLLISTSLPVKSFLKDPLFLEIEKKDFVFIDLASGKKGETNINGFRVFYIENPANTTALRIVLEEAVRSLEKNAFVVFESVSVLSVYLKKDVLEKFVYFLCNYISLSDDTGIIISIKEPVGNESIELIKQFCSQFYDFSGVSMAEIEKI